MIKLFQKDMAVQAVLIVVALLLLWGDALLAPPPMKAGDHPAAIYGLVCSWLTPAPRLAVVLAMLLVLAEGVMLNLLLANVNLVSQNSLLPTLLYLVAMKAGTDTLTPIVLVNGIVLASLRQLVLRGTLLTITPDKICGATLLIGLASLCYQPAVILLLSYLLIASNYRLYSWKDWLLMLLGFAAPYALLALILYMTDGFAGWWADTIASLKIDTISVATTASNLRIAGSLLLGAVLLWSLIMELGRMSKRPVLWQKNAATVMFFTVGGLGMLLYTHLLPLTMSLFAIPFAFSSYRLLTPTKGFSTGFGRHKQHTWGYDLLLILIFIAAMIC